jgi:hypothetical protein
LLLRANLRRMQPLHHCPELLLLAQGLSLAWPRWRTLLLLLRLLLLRLLLLLLLRLLLLLLRLLLLLGASRHGRQQWGALRLRPMRGSCRAGHSRARSRLPSKGSCSWLGGGVSLEAWPASPKDGFAEQQLEPVSAPGGCRSCRCWHARLAGWRLGITQQCAYWCRRWRWLL